MGRARGHLGLRQSWRDRSIKLYKTTHCHDLENRQDQAGLHPNRVKSIPSTLRFATIASGTRSFDLCLLTSLARCESRTRPAERCLRDNSTEAWHKYRCRADTTGFAARNRRCNDIQTT
ncbi:hypothetical protein G647_01503 [Cladophialophora carrionii CBS 160.54]|uniref:Uncharacterized protein n=1 Tax=Cladophialophora carrionii CBS 160.54 TaxID=1279043 RepID=V9DQ94_9EURO|nr:uncharacterized protein G647_01503 [Cladophialophora carrionii CBS 160.54]ETI29050.1 hypothetical protein G647_01503 [Cladophialophora carrionii CBS 160.54]